ncbi:alpha/beta fold hydrolase [Halomarina halobia]|uniref:Alpha/beta fold hydrolase n=1 Tax=Halomarina halobia TaxID=3033386 RepID=A0ABD6A5W1_9EURY|nr:alpha/beta fold hydrolase [Halomarina sp. PSR21]
MPTVRTNGVETYYERRGEGPPIVFVHASIVDHAMWDRQADALADDYATIVYDVRGHGRTGGSGEPEYTMDLLAEDLYALVTALDLDRPVLCGLSMGGMIAQAYAAAHPDRIAGLVLADTFTPRILTRGEWFLRRVALNALIPPVRLVGYERVERANVWLTERLFGGVSGDYERIERLRETGPKMATDEFAKVIRSVTRFHGVAIDLSAITVPTLVLYGENELPFVKRHAAELAVHLSDVEIDEVPHAGHASNLDNPDSFTAAVRAFLTRIDPVEGTDAPDGDTETEPR